MDANNNSKIEGDMADTEISKLENQIFELTAELNKLRKSNSGDEVHNYTFATISGDTDLLSMFGDKKQLLLIHNMGQVCRYCTLWADGFNGFLKHLESVMSVVMVSKEAVLQRSDGSVLYRLVGTDRVERIRIETGIHRGELVEIRGDVTPRDWIVVRGHTGLIDGSAVSVRDADGAAVSAAALDAGGEGSDG